MVDAVQHLMTIFGNDDGLVNDHASRHFALLTEGTNDFSHEIIDGACSDSDDAAAICHQVVEALQTMPFFPGRKVVWLKGAVFFGDSVMGKSESTERGLRQLQKIIEHGLPDDLCLLISATEFDKRKSFNKLLIKSGASQEYNKPDISQDGWEAEVAALARQAASERGLELERSAMELLIHRISESSRQIISEIEKLDLYLGDRRLVTEQDVDQMVSQTRSGIIFEISRAIENCKTAEAINLIDAQLEDGEQPVSIIRAAIIPTLRNLVSAKILCDHLHLKTLNYREFTRQLEEIPAYAKSIIPLKKDGTLSPYPLFLAAQKVKRFSLPQLKSALKTCFEADKSLVSTSFDARLVLHRLVISIAS
ncbi:MAG: DNA polymerase III subunit delta [Akkermansia sp.]